MYTAPFRFSKISPQTFSFLKNAYTVSLVLFFGGIAVFFGAMIVNIPHLIQDLTFIPFVMGGGAVGFIIIPLIFTFFELKSKLEMTLEGDKMIFLDKNTKEMVVQNSVQNITDVSLYTLPLGKTSRMYVLLLEDNILGLQPFVMSSGSRVIFFKSLFEFEAELSKNGLRTQGMQDKFIQNKKIGQISLGIFSLALILFLIYRFLF